MAITPDGSAAHEVQKRLLTLPPAIAGVDLAVSWVPHGDVGGDFYDFVMLEEESLGVTLGDISGKGYDAALLMVYALAELRAGLRNNLRLPYLMAQLDESLKKYSAGNRFAEVLIGIYAPSSRRFVFVQGGGIFPLVFHQTTERLFLNSGPTYRVPGFPFAADRRRRYVEASVELELNDFLLLMSDGISEREVAPGRQVVGRDEFGALVSPSLKELCIEHRQGSAGDLLAGIQRMLDSLSSERRDDETMIVLKGT